MKLTDDFFDSYIVMVAANLFSNKEIDYLCYRYILDKYRGYSYEFN